MTTDAILSCMHRVLSSESAAIASVADTLASQQDAITQAVHAITSRCGEELPGRVVTTGVGKAGFIARKIGATLASTGTPSLFLHPTEAKHGDLGCVRRDDIVLAFSNSGSSEEIVSLIPSLRLIGCTVIAMVGKINSPLALHADIVLHIGAVAEACPMGLAPSTSTTTLLALGDALAIAILEQRKFTPEQYARFHPGGALGRKLMTCQEVMRGTDRIAIAPPGTTVADAMRHISQARTGSIMCVDAKGNLVGIFTDGDLRRRLLASPDPSTLLHSQVHDVATSPGLRISASELVEKALNLCASKKINELPVVDDLGRPVGLIDVQDLADRGFAAI